MKPSAFHILRVGTAITFLWIAVLIIKDPDVWVGLVQPWVANLIPFSLEKALIDTAILDFTVGFLLLIDKFVFAAALLGFIHMVTVLIVTGITVITVRDIAVLAGTLALAIQVYPTGFRPKTIKDFLSLLTK